MADLFDRIRDAILDDRYVVGEHAADRLRERGILEWQAVEGIAHATLIREAHDALPHPKVEVAQLLPDGTMVKAIWSWLPYNGVAKLVTIHYLDE